MYLNKLTVAIFRTMLSLIFIVAGINHLIHGEGVLRKLENAAFHEIAWQMGDPRLLIFLSGIALLTGGISFAVGFKTRLAAMGLLITLIPITLIVQVGSLATLGPLFKNVAIAGGLLFFIVHGDPGYSMDRLLSKLFSERKLEFEERKG